MGGWLLWGLLPILILRSVEFEQTSRENQHLCAHLQMSQYMDIPIGLHSALQEIFHQATKIVSHLTIPEQRPLRASSMLPEPWHFPRPGLFSWAPLLGWTHSKCPLLLPMAPAIFSRISCIIALDNSQHPSLSLWIRRSELLSSPHWLFGEASILSLL